jgi:hypothetical protein
MVLSALDEAGVIELSQQVIELVWQSHKRRFGMKKRSGACGPRDLFERLDLSQQVIEPVDEAYGVI